MPTNHMREGRDAFFDDGCMIAFLLMAVSLLTLLGGAVWGAAKVIV